MFFIVMLHQSLKRFIIFPGHALEDEANGFLYYSTKMKDWHSASSLFKYIDA